MLMVDGFATFFRVLVMVVGILTVLPSYRFPGAAGRRDQRVPRAAAVSIAGQCLMAAANDLIMVFIGLEISSIASYVLAGYLRDDKRSNEAALKYFLLGSLRHGLLPVRRGSDLRRHRQRQPDRRARAAGAGPGRAAPVFWPWRRP
jgi:NADH-quinone oxidoreductase subunit N